MQPPEEVDRVRPASNAWNVPIVVGAFLLTLPPLVLELGSGLDPSWQIGLHLARERGLVVGRDVFFTYGPWGFLTVPLAMVRSQWLASAAFHLFAHVAIYLTIGLWTLRRGAAAWKTALAVLPLVLLGPLTEYGVLLALVLAGRLVTGAARPRSMLAAGIGLLAGALVFVKFSMGFAAGMILFASAVAAALVGRRTTALAWLAGFGAGVVVFGSVPLGTPTQIAQFLSVSWEISSGYNLALERQGPLWQPVAVLAAFLGTAATALLASRSRSVWPMLLPAAGLFVVAFKHGFVRHETHGHIAMTVTAVLVVWMWLDRDGDTEASPLTLGSRAVLPFAMCLMALIARPPHDLATLPLTRAQYVTDAIRTWRQSGSEEHRERLRADLRDRVPLPPAILDRIGDHTVDVMTVEIALMEAWELNWTPRRVLQSYAVSTARLDAMDAEFFAGPRAPERLLVDLQGLDTRHPFMDSPLTWRQIVSRYDPMGWDRRWILLARRQQPRELVRRPIVSGDVPLNTAVEVPEPKSGHLEIAVVITPSLAGRLAALPWKVPDIRVAIDSDSEAQPRRMVADSVRSAFPLIDPWPDSPSELGRLFSGARLSPPRGIALLTRGSWAWSDAELHFFEVEWVEPLPEIAPYTARR